MKRILFAFVWLLCGCGPSLIAVTPSVDKRVSYSLNEIRYARTGNVMIGVARIYTLPTFIAIDAQDKLVFNPIRARNELRNNPDQAWLGSYKLPRKTGYVIVNDAAASYGIHIQNSGHIIEDQIRLPNNAKADQEAWPESVSQFKRVSPILLEGSFQAALVYVGKSGSEIQMVYREYLGGSKQPAFTQDLTYDLDISPIIVFKSLEIEVIDASPSRIQFTVLEDGGLPWLSAVREN